MTSEHDQSFDSLPPEERLFRMRHSAAHVLAENGLCVVCADARTPSRVLDFAPSVGLSACSRRDVFPAASYKGALFSVWTFRRSGLVSGACVIEPPFVARDAAGQRTADSLALRAFFDLDAPLGEAASPRVRQRSQRAGDE